jgi:hypothetical protein
MEAGRKSTGDSKSGSDKSLTDRAFIEALLGEKGLEVIDVEAVSHTCARSSVLNDCDVSVAIIVAGSRAVQDSECVDFTSVQADDHVAVLCFSSVSVVHFLR